MKIAKVILPVMALCVIMSLASCKKESSITQNNTNNNHNNDSSISDNSNGTTNSSGITNGSNSSLSSDIDLTGYVNIKEGLKMNTTIKNSYYSANDKTKEQLYIEVIDNCNDSIVDLFVSSRYSSSLGSGVLFGWDEELKLSYILTCFHMIDDISSCKVVDINDCEYEGSVVGAYPDQDLAILAVKTPTDHSLTYASLLDKGSKLYTGQEAIAIGNNNGYSHTASDGIISYANRKWNTSLYDYKTLNQIQISTEINGGNSGGGLFSTSGALIGITNAGVETSTSGSSIEGIKFAIPYSEMWKVIDDFFSTAMYNPNNFSFYEGYVLNDYEFSFSVSAMEYFTSSGIKAYNTITSINSSNNSYSDYGLLKTNDIILDYQIDYCDESKTDTAKISLVNQDTSVLLKAINSSDLSLNDKINLTIIRNKTEIGVVITLKQFRYISAI